MATEEELANARRAHASALQEAGAAAYPNDFRPTEIERKRREEALALLNDPRDRKSVV